MQRTNLRRLVCLLVLAAGSALISLGAHAEAPPSNWTVTSATQVEKNLLIVLVDGRVMTLPLANGQCSFVDIQVAPNRASVGWTEGGDAEGEGDTPCSPKNQYVAGGPVIWRAGKIIRRFDDWGAELSWSFEANGNQVASHAGPLHFDNEQAWNLYDIATGLLLKHWQCSDKKPKPDWASPDLECGE